MTAYSDSNINRKIAEERAINRKIADERAMEAQAASRRHEVCEVQALNNIPEQIQLLDNDNDGLELWINRLEERLAGVTTQSCLNTCGKNGNPEPVMSTVASQIKHQRERVQQACARLHDIFGRLEL